MNFDLLSRYCAAVDAVADACDEHERALATPGQPNRVATHYAYQKALKALGRARHALESGGYIAYRHGPHVYAAGSCAPRGRRG
jgi:hypothetical protein